MPLAPGGRTGGRGSKVAAMFWPGSETVIGGGQATYWTPFDDDMPHATRVGRVLSWLNLPDGQRPSFLTLYYSDVDSSGHSSGPESEAVRAAIARLPKKQRATMILRMYHELPHDQIAVILGSSVGAVKANFFHALANLKKLELLQMMRRCSADIWSQRRPEVRSSMRVLKTAGRFSLKSEPPDLPATPSPWASS